MNIRFWGVRGSVAVSGTPWIRTGGNTTCVELEHEGERIVLDGGTGLPAMGRGLELPAKLSLLFTHVHWDHIQGVPFFNPLFHPDSEIAMYGGPTEEGSLRDALAAQMRPPQFPVGIDVFPAKIEFGEIDPKKTLDIGPFKVSATEMTHPQGVLVYRVEAGGKSVVFATDVEHGDRLDPRLLRFAEGADLLIHDAQYTNAEYPSRRGFGHSTWQQAVDTGLLAGAERVALFHHDPTRVDDQVAVIEDRARQRHSGAFAAREGVTVSI